MVSSALCFALWVLSLIAPCYLVQALGEVSLLQTSLTVDMPPPLVTSMLAAGAPAHDKATACRRLQLSIVFRSLTLAKPEVVEPIAQAIIKHVDDHDVVTACFKALESFNPTYLDRRKALAVNAAGPSIPVAVNAVLAHYPHDRKMQKQGLMYVSMFTPYVACEVQPPYLAAGCLDRVWDALDYFRGREYTDVQMSAWMGFEDHAQCRGGAEAIANHGGPGTGISRLVQAVKEAVGVEFHPDNVQDSSLITLQYDIMKNANAVLSQADARNGFLDAFVREGYPQAVLAAMRDQPDEQSTSSSGCAALSILTQNATCLEALKELGAVELVAATMERFKTPDHHTFMGRPASAVFPVLPPCDAVLRNYAAASATNLDTMLRLGVLETYESVRSDVPLILTDMGKLPKLLRARKQEREA